MHRGLDALTAKEACNLVAVCMRRQNHRHNVIGRSVIGSKGNADGRARLRERLSVGVGQHFAMTIPAWQTSELSKADSRPKVIHPIVETQHRDIVVRRSTRQPLHRVTGHSMPAHLPDSREQKRISHKDDAALGSRHILVAIEAECCRRAVFSNAINTDRMGGVFNQEKPLACGKIRPCIPVIEVSGIVHQNDGTRPARTFRFRVRY